MHLRLSILAQLQLDPVARKRALLPAIAAALALACGGSAGPSAAARAVAEHEMARLGLSAAGQSTVS